jgi:hypothetical protein
MGFAAHAAGVASPTATNCASAVTIAAGALQPAAGCRISRILLHGAQGPPSERRSS